MKRFLLLLLIALPLAAQSPNTATLIVDITDETGAHVSGAKVAVVNSATGAVREVSSDNGGTGAFPALSVTGTYLVTVSKAGFGSEERNDVALRAGEIATLKEIGRAHV